MNTTPAALPLSMPRAWHMINGEPTPVIKKIWMIDQPAQITFEVAEIDGIEANERGEQTPVSLKGLRVALARAPSSDQADYLLPLFPSARTVRHTMFSKREFHKEWKRSFWRETQACKAGQRKCLFC